MLFFFYTSKKKHHFCTWKYLDLQISSENERCFLFGSELPFESFSFNVAIDSYPQKRCSSFLSHSAKGPWKIKSSNFNLFLLNIWKSQKKLQGWSLAQWVLENITIKSINLPPKPYATLCAFTKFTWDLAKVAELTSRNFGEASRIGRNFCAMIWDYSWC